MLRITNPTTQLFLFIILLTACQPQKPTAKASEKIEYYGSGAVQRRIPMIGGKKDGKMTDYYLDGKLKGERWFQNDLQIDKSVLYYQNGAIQEVQYYEAGKKQGGDTVFYENGHAQFALTYNAGLKDGYLRKWSEDGHLIFEARYEKDSLVEVKGEVLKKKKNMGGM